MIYKICEPKWTLANYVVLLCNVLSVITITVLIFVHWQKGPALWLCVSQPLFYTLLIINYVLTPIGFIAVFALQYFQPTLIPFASNLTFYVFYLVLCVCHFIDYFTFIRPVILKDAQYFCRAK